MKHLKSFESKQRPKSKSIKVLNNNEEPEYQESMKNVKSFKLFESPDYISKLGLEIYQGRPFAVVYDHVKFGKQGYYHDDCGLIGDVSGIKYPGRIWIDEKCISFWVYPTKEEFINIINQMEDILNIEMFNNNWFVEIYEFYNGLIAGVDVLPDDDYIFDIAYEDDGYYKLIPIEEYAGSENIPEEERAIHLLSWAEKQELKKKGWGKGFGSDLTAWDSKNPLAWRHAKYQENKQQNF